MRPFEWQEVNVGDEVRLAPEVGLVVALLDRGRSRKMLRGIKARAEQR